jgi:hypothetical protein
VLLSVCSSQHSEGTVIPKQSENTHPMTTESCPVRLEALALCLRVRKNSHIQGRTLTNKDENHNEIKGNSRVMYVCCYFQ